MNPQSTVVTVYATCFNINKTAIFATMYIYVFVIPTINSYYFPEDC
jgi:hypothetical protein